MSLIDDADHVRVYHDLLTDEVAQESHAMLEAQLRHRGLIFGDRALCTVLRPRFVTPAQYLRMQHRVETLMRAFAAAYEAAMADPAEFGWEDGATPAAWRRPQRRRASD